ncbi:hypothetical protein NDU88_004372 [Pleurodeles waltl]|uniref:Uncharacterized protein n=1 Tax=Pleurodeles waltl TaxID=8319 RepID=A0AAV7M870_PLEWA|nr:hypothetical protein NDU88_004372 [Pleurodeles waltl]
MPASMHPFKYSADRHQEPAVAMTGEGPAGGAAATPETFAGEDAEPRAARQRFLLCQYNFENIIREARVNSYDETDFMTVLLLRNFGIANQTENTFADMPFFVPLVIMLIFSALGGLYLLGLFRRRRTNEPPLDKGIIPWLGHALQCKDNAAEFLKKMQEKHGDIFTVHIGGYYITFLMDPLSFDSVLKESRSKLDFEKFAQDLSARFFSYYSTPSGPKHLQTSSIKYLMGDGLVVVTQAMMENVQKLMLYSVGSGEHNRTWKQDGLSHFTYKIVFRAGYLSLFGNESAKQAGSTEKAKELDRVLSEELYHEFRKYDRLFPRLAYTILSLKEKLEVDRLKKYF